MEADWLKGLQRQALWHSFPCELEDVHTPPMAIPLCDAVGNMEEDGDCKSTCSFFALQNITTSSLCTPGISTRPDPVKGATTKNGAILLKTGPKSLSFRKNLLNLHDLTNESSPGVSLETGIP